MSHLTEGVLTVLRDGDDPGPGSGVDVTAALRHLGDCAHCRRALEARRAEGDATREALTALDDVFDVAAARAVIRRRISEEPHPASALPAGRGPRRWAAALRGSGALARAAGLVLIAAVGASALPGSPVRSWIAARTGADAPSGSSAPSPAPSREPAIGEPAGIRLSVGAPLTVRLRGLAAGEQVTVLWVPGSEVAVFAGSGSRFDAGQDGVEATVSRGPVRLELPLDVRPLTLEVGGRPWIRHVEGGTRYLVGPEIPGRQPLVFVVPDPGDA